MSGKKASQQLKRLLEGIERTSLVHRTEEERAADREAEELAERYAVRNLFVNPNCLFFWGRKLFRIFYGGDFFLLREGTMK